MNTLTQISEIEAARWSQHNVITV